MLYERAKKRREEDSEDEERPVTELQEPPSEVTVEEARLPGALPCRNPGTVEKTTSGGRLSTRAIQEVRRAVGWM